MTATTTKAMAKFITTPKQAIRSFAQSYKKKHPVQTYIFMFAIMPVMVLSAIVLCLMIIDIPLGIFFSWKW